MMKYSVVLNFTIMYGYVPGRVFRNHIQIFESDIVEQNHEKLDALIITKSLFLFQKLHLSEKNFSSMVIHISMSKFCEKFPQKVYLPKHFARQNVHHNTTKSEPFTVLSLVSAEQNLPFQSLFYSDNES